MASGRETRSGQGAARSRGGAFRQVSAGLRAGLTEAAARRGFAVPEVLLRWAEIAGAALAPHCRPVEVRYGRGPSLGATLVVETEGGRGPEIEMSAPAILERVNAFYGYRAVTRLRIVQAGPGGLAEDGAGFEGPGQGDERATLAAARAEAARLAEGFRSPGLRGVMARLGAHVLSRPEGAATYGRDETDQGDRNADRS